MTGWEISVGLYPGVLLGIRSYVENGSTDHVLYIPFVDISLEIHDN